MKRWIYVTGLMVMISLSTMAQRKGGERPSPEERANRSTEQMAEKLALTEAQKQQLLAINLEFAKKNEVERKAEMEARKVEMDARKAEMKEQDAKIQAVLTEEQRTKWAELKAERMDDPRRRRPNAQIEADPRRGNRGGGN
ncbi:DUF4890 domain-containing protein [Algoriphagus antarcticus]|uniref:Uncharacterized protein DUF4890 n=1 Tax=Algoriphagus antarcticus TaxID=238540 RepID=A0A3E0DUQ2_9BACT|nr:DUF4890 domain-containing protein [Algoriphagus antarcticus]REG87116.1 uncharacterized protein DUF4890 [Algoriphagus antarcticus]